MENIVGELRETFSGFLPHVAAALGILVIGWIIALVASAVVRGALRRTQLDEKLSSWLAGDDGKTEISAARWAGKAVYYLILAFVLIAFFQVLGLSGVSAPLGSMLENLFEYLPQLLSAGLLLLLAWIVATVVKLLVGRGLSAARIDERLGETAAAEHARPPVSLSIATALYWLVFLLFLPLVLDALSLEGLLMPLQEMLAGVMGYLPQVVAAGLILVIGWFAARIVSQIVTNLLAAAGADRVGETEDGRSPFGERKLSGLLGLIVYVLILLPAAIAALDALQIEAISRPASNMLESMLAAVPSIATAALVILVAFFVGRWVSGLAAELLAGLGFDRILVTLGLSQNATTEERSPSKMAGTVVLIAILYFATLEASALLGFDAFGALLVQFAEFAGRVLVGLVLFGVGLYLANLAARFVRDSQPPERAILSTATRVSIVALASAMALRHMGLGEQIITIAFGSLLAAIALAAALAFGLGAREVAGQEVRRWIEGRRAGGGGGLTG
ncbi:MAG: mechanosensitive ion channel [Acidobacteriota bacterium]|nr:mechanosensitive ion channel [Acidobacteriota bacterium]